MNAQHFARMKRQASYRPAVAFILALRAEGVPLAVIGTNDWHSNTRPSVYIDVKGARIVGKPYRRSVGHWSNHLGHLTDNVRRCERLDRLGLLQAVNWYAKKTVYVRPR